jgi:hypothetical protein
VIVVYGPAQHQKSEEFLQELRRKCMRTKVPLVIRGDFNLIRGKTDKSDGNIDWRLVDILMNSLLTINCKNFGEVGTGIHGQTRNLILLWLIYAES